MTDINWSWTASNGTATAEQTEKAYTALTTNGPTSDFAAVVWNDLIDMISAQRVAWDNSAWDESILSMSDTKMFSGDTMTAMRFNAAVANIWPITEWPWAETLGRTAFLKGDRCNGSYFLNLAAALNRWAADIERLFLSFSLHGTVDADIDVKLPDPLYMRFLLELQSASMRANISLCDALCIMFSETVASAFSLSGMTLAQALQIGFDNTIYAVAKMSGMWLASALPFGFSEEVSVHNTETNAIVIRAIYTAFDLTFSAGISAASMRLARALRMNLGLLSAACQTFCEAAIIQALAIRIKTNLNLTAETDVDVVGARVDVVSVCLPVDTKISIKAKIKEPRLVLASELDDILAAVLDDKLVTNAELDFT